MIYSQSLFPLYFVGSSVQTSTFPPQPQTLLYSLKDGLLAYSHVEALVTKSGNFECERPTLEERRSI